MNGHLVFGTILERWLALYVILILLVSACEGRRVTIDAKSWGGTVVVEEDDVTAIQLPGTPTTGY
jgi:hypothetical protein